MFRFVHSADWQLGARFAQFGATAERLRAQRPLTLRAALVLAHERAADAFLVAGDLFEDNQVADTLVEETLGIFAAFPEVPVYLLPGNHDPASGPGSVWSRRQFRAGALPRNVTVLREASATPVRTRDGREVSLLAAPLHQKVSTVDPSLRLRDLVREQPADRVKIGLTHGALAIPGKHQPNDFPIDPTAATRAGLDYLGIGHWHNWQVYDAGRVVMPGTPEPDAFGQDAAGRVAYVEIDGPQAPLRVEALPVGGLHWACWEYEFSEWDAARAALELHAASLGDALARAVCRVRLTGSAGHGPCAQAKEWLHERFRGALHCQVQDDTRPTLSPGELRALEGEHPILCQVLGDLHQLELLATGQAAADEDLPTPAAALTLADAQTLAAGAKLELASLDASDFLAARELLFGALHDAAGCV
ncbi:MAG: DNA repair exonuclease [Caulobacteraceae bacterium]|nr:DNA repair exonuclease [Caulobacter sp.]